MDALHKILNLGVADETQTVVCELEGHGPYLSRHVFGKVWTGCPTCGGIEQQLRVEAEANQRRETARKNWEAKLRGSAIPERFLSRSLDNYEARTPGQRMALAFAREFARQFAEDNTGRCAVFCGQPGTGKTHLAVGIARQIMVEHGRTALYTTTQRAMRRIKDTWRRDSAETESQAIAALVFPDLLILDEVGVQFGSDTEQNLLFDMLNERYEKRKSTIFMSNLEPEECIRFLGERVFDRLREDGGAVVPFHWDSFRTGSAA